MPNGIANKRFSLHLSAVVGMGLLLSACSGDITLPDPNPNPNPNPTPTPTEQVGLIKGQVAAGETTKVSAEEPPISAPVTAAGKFDLPLPNGAFLKASNSFIELPDYFGLCSGVTTNAPRSVKVRPINKLREADGTIIIAPVNSDPKIYSYKSWLFSDTEVTFSFKGSCVGLDNINTQLSLKKGWNVLDVKNDVSAKKTTFAIASQPKPLAETYTMWVKNSSSMPAQALLGNTLEPWKNLPQYRNR